MNGVVIKFCIIFIFAFALQINLYSQKYIEFVDSADYYIKHKEWQKAEDMTISALRTMPANKLNYLLWSNLGDIRTNLGRYDDALQAFDIALASKPEEPKILSKRAYANLVAGNPRDAMNDIDRSLRIDSVQEWALQVRGMVDLENGKYENAEKVFNFLKSKFPFNPESYIGLGKIALAKNDQSKAASLFRESIIKEDTSEARFLLIYMLIQNEKIQDAKDELHIALKRYPKEGKLYLLRGLIHKLSFQNESAQIDRKNAIAFGADKDLVNKILPE